MQSAGFTISNSATIIIGFSLTGSNIAPGEGVLCYISTSGDLSVGDSISIENLIFSGSSGQALSVNDIPPYIVEDEEDNFHFNLEISETGSSTLFIFEDSVSMLDDGDEVGLFDSNGYLNESGAMGELLVGRGVWANEQLNVIAIMGEDLTSFGGPVLPGAVEGNPMVLKVLVNTFLISVF